MDTSPQQQLPKHLRDLLKNKVNNRPLEGYLNAQEEVDCFQVGSLSLQQAHQEKTIKAQIAESLGVPVNQLCLGSSPQSLRSLLLQLTCSCKRDHCIALSPQRPEVQQLMAVHQVQQTVLPLKYLLELPVDSIKNQTGLNSRLLLLDHPNAITGALLQKFDIADVVTSFDGWVLIDETAIGATPIDSMKTMVATCNNAMVLQRTIGGLAVLIAHPEVVQLVEQCRVDLPFAQLQYAAKSMIFDTQKEKELVIATLQKERKQLKKVLEVLPFVEQVYPSHTNSLLLSVKKADEIVDFLRESERILVYRVPPIEDLPNGIRLTLGTPLDNLRLRNALEQLPEKMNPKRAFWGDLSKGLRKAGSFFGFFKKILGV
ncbi:MAG: aminotransferase class I/II-fold pyridoxal phosphate-dependent enzyme [Aureispira sp.]